MTMTSPIKREPRLYEYRGEQLTLAQIASRTGIATAVLRGRMRIGWSIERATSEPAQKYSPRQHDRSCYCGAPAVTKAGRCPACLNTRPAADATIDASTPFWQDDRAIEFVLDHPRGADLHVIGKVVGMTSEGVRRVEARALAKLRAALKLRRIHAVGDLALGAGERR